MSETLKQKRRRKLKKVTRRKKAITSKKTSLTKEDENQEIYRKRVRYGLSGHTLIGTGDYCPDCGGLCGNDKHSRRW